MDNFDCTQLTDNMVSELREVAARIRGRRTANAIDIGHDLIRVKGQIGHGEFTKWVENDCDLTIRTAQNYMNVARWADAKNENVTFLERVPLSVLYELAADDVPAEAENVVIASFLAGTRLTAAEVARRIAQAREDIQEAEAAADSVVEDLRDITKDQQRRALLRIFTELLGAWAPDERDALLAALAAVAFADATDLDGGGDGDGDDLAEQPAELEEVVAAV
jgi:hypothetical protein